MAPATPTEPLLTRGDDLRSEEGLGSGLITVTDDKDRGSQEKIFEYVDSTASWLMRQWEMNHSGQGRVVSSCCLTLIINNSPLSVQMLAADIVSGRAIWSLGSEGSYCAVRCSGDGDENAPKLIPPGGYVLLLACGNTPSFFHSGNIEVNVETSAFNVSVTNNEEKTAFFVVKKEPFHAEFVEKSNTDRWSKYVLLITQEQQQPQCSSTATATATATALKSMDV
jgi:hypothetical protein